MLVKIPPPGQDNDSDVKYGGKSLSWSRLSLREGRPAKDEAGGGTFVTRANNETSSVLTPRLTINNDLIHQKPLPSIQGSNYTLLALSLS